MAFKLFGSALSDSGWCCSCDATLFQPLVSCDLLHTSRPTGRPWTASRHRRQGVVGATALVRIDDAGEFTQ